MTTHGRAWSIVGMPLVLPIGWIMACGDVYADPDAVDGGSVSTSVKDEGGVSPVTNVTQCPSLRPRENTECQTTGSACEYGTSPDPTCNTVLGCVGDGLRIYWTPRISAQPDCRQGQCPARAEITSLDGKPCSIDGSTSDADEIVCNMSDGVCACTTGPNGTSTHPRTWVCARPSSSVCPSSRPLAGQTCFGGAYCDYGSCLFKRGILMQCANSVWVTGGATCP